MFRRFWSFFPNEIHSYILSCFIVIACNSDAAAAGVLGQKDTNADDQHLSHMVEGNIEG